MTENALSPPRLCKNCSNLLQGNFCSYCGQADKDVKRPVLTLLKELSHVIFELDGRAYKTLFFVFTRPGFLSKEYVQGRRASYTPPLRLFLVLSILLFFTLSLNSFIDGLDTSMVNTETSTPAQLTDENTSPSNAATQSPVEPADTNLGLTVSTDDGEIISDFDALEEFISTIVAPIISSETNDRLKSFLVSQTQTNYRRIREDPSEFIYGSLEYITAFLLFMMPLMAMIQAILYIGSRRYYIEHFVLTLHNHTFLILTALLRLPLEAIEASSISAISGPAGFLVIAINFWTVAYLFLSMRRFYGGGYLLTALKFFTATATYAVLLAVGLAIFMAINFILF